jgi:transcriptional regulator with XRE-family HTH domain
MLFSERIKEIRKVKNLSQLDLANKIGMDRAQYSRIETGKVEPNLATIRKIADALEVDIVDLFKDDNAFDINSHNKSFVEKVKVIEELDEEQRKILFAFIDMASTNKRLKDMFSNALNIAS